MNKRDTLAAAAVGDGCLGRSRDDEPVFVLCARDPLAPALVREWAFCYERLNGASPKVDEALQLADQMRVWRETRG